MKLLLIEKSRCRAAISRYCCHLFKAVCVSAVFCLPSVSFAQTFFVDDTRNVGGPFYSGESWGAAWGDLNGDGFPDLFASNHGTLNSILRNNGDGTFSETVSLADAERVWTGEPLSDIHGGAWGDFDNDGDQDMFVTRSSQGARVHLMRNSGLGGFTEEGAETGVGPFGGGRMPMLLDYTNDGFLDLILARVRNDGAQVFRFDPASDRFLLESDETGFNSQCFDNSYGFASDLFNTGQLHYICANEQRVPERIFDTSVIPFADKTSTANSIGTNSDAILADFNNDLKMDLFATRGFLRPSGAERISSTRIEAWFSVGGSINPEKSFTFRADGPISIDAHARHVGEADGLRIGEAAFAPSRLPVTLDPNDTQNHGVASSRDERRIFVEYNPGSQEWTIYLNGGGQSEGAYITVTGSGLTEPSDVVGLNAVDFAIQPRMLLNNGTRLENAGARGIGAVSCASIGAADFDNDMDVDLYLVCRTSTANLENRLYLNDGNGNFSLSEAHGGEGPVAAGLDSRAGSGETVVVADYNVDGLMDLFVTNGGRLFPHVVKDGFTGGGPNTFLRNVIDNDNHWLQFDLQGVSSNRDGFGAKVIVTASGVSQLREQNGMHHRWSHDSRRLHFGMGVNTTADVTIEWPNGTVDTHSGVATDRLYSAVQGGALTQFTPTLNEPSVAVTSAAISEGETATLEVSVFPPSPVAVAVDYETADLDAVQTLDYSPSTGTLLFAPFETEKTVNVESLVDIDDEVDERFQLLLTNPIEATLNQGVGLIDLADDDDGGAAGPVVTVTGGSANEGDSVSFNFSLSQASTETITIPFVTEPGTASNADFVGRSGRVVLQPGVVSVNRQVATTQDSAVESDEDFVLRLGELINANVLENRIIGTIVDDDTRVTSISINSVSVDEGDTASLTVSLAEASTDEVVVDFEAVSDSAQLGSDFAASTGQLNFAPGQLTKTISVVTLQDTAVEGDEVISVQLANPVNATLTQQSGAITIEDDDTTSNGPTVTVSGGEALEGDRIPFTIELSAPSTNPVTVDFNTVAGSATSDVDFVPRTTGRVTFSPGQLSAVRRITTLQDSAIEADETFELRISNPQNANIAQTSAIGIIIDDDDTTGNSSPAVSISNSSVEEGERAAFTVSLSEPSASDVTVDFSTVAGSAVSDVDFEARAIGRITFPAGVVSVTRRVSTIEDSIVESNETFSVVLSNPSNTTIADGTGVATIVDNDGAPVGPEISINNATVVEGDRAVFTISLSASSTEVVTVDFKTAEGSATSDVDFESRNVGRITFQPGVVSAIRRIVTLQDNEVEPSENFRLELSNASNASISDSVGNAVITDDD